MQNKKAKNKRNSRQKGFSLIEVLIAIAILAAITIPLAMNMISTSQINSKSKSTSTAADLSASVLESMQSVNLSDLLVEMNGYETNEYGEKLAYSIVDNSLHGYTIGNKFEARVSKEGTTSSYIPVQKQTNGIADSLVTSSIKVRQTTNDGVIKTYFTGHKDEDGKIDNSYSVVMQDVHNDEDSFDIVMDIEEGQSYDIANINAMDQSDIVNMFEYGEDAKDVVRTIISNNEMAHSISSSIPLLGDVNGDGDVDTLDATKLRQLLQDPSYDFTSIKNVCDVNGDGRVTDTDAQNIQRQSIDLSSDFGSIYKKEYTIDIIQDKNSEATNIIIKCAYRVMYPELVGEKNKVIEKTIGSFSTNSTFEFARGLYLYYIPHSGDKFTVNNRNELSTTVYLIASDIDNTVLSSNNYHPSIAINELSSQVYTDSARTTVCSNVPDDQWLSKTVVPAKNKELEIKTLANVGNQQTLYNVSVRIYKHNKSSFNDQNVFEPNEKNLLIQTDGSFLDNSVMHDIDSNKTTGVSIDDTLATVIPRKVVYNGESQIGYTASNVTLSGVTEAVDAGKYTVFAKPNTGYAWADGTTTQKSFVWEISCLKEAKASLSGTSKFVYDGQVHEPVVLNDNNIKNVMISGHTTGKDVGLYRTIVIPKKNYAWANATEGNEREIRYIDWEITPKPVNVDWKEITWMYDGLTHIAKCEVKPSDLVNDDSCGLVLNNHMIKNIGSQVANIVGLTNKNYTLINTTKKSETITVTSSGSVALKSNDTIFDYNGQAQGLEFTPNNEVIKVVSGTISETNAGEYEAIVGLETGYKWAQDSNNSDETYGNGNRTFSWKINPVDINVKWGKPEWYKNRSNGEWATIEENGEEIRCHFVTKNNTLEIDEIQWPYDGKEHSIKYYYFVNKDGNRISESLGPNLENNSITNVGSTIVNIDNFENENYKCKDTLTLRITPEEAYFSAQNGLKYTGDSKYCAAEYNNVQLVETKTSDNKSYPVTWNGGAPPNYDANKEYSVEDVINQTNAGVYVIHLKPMDNCVWKGATTEAEKTATKEFIWTIAPAADAWFAGMTYDNGKLSIESNITYLYTGDPVECSYGENINLYGSSGGTVVSGTIEGSARDISDSDQNTEVAEDIEIAWVKATEKGHYTVKAKPAVNHAWLDGTTTEKTIEFIIGYPTYTPRFNMSPLAWIEADYRYYNGNVMGPYFTDFLDCYPLNVLNGITKCPSCGRSISITDVKCPNPDCKTPIKQFKNENTEIEVWGDKEKWLANDNYKLSYKNNKKTTDSGDYNWKIKRRPIEISSISTISKSESEIQSIEALKELIINNLNIKASSKLIEEALTFGFAKQVQEEPYRIETWDNDYGTRTTIDVNGTIISGLKKNMRFVKGNRKSDNLVVSDGASYTVTYQGENKLAVAVSVRPQDETVHVHDANLQEIEDNGVIKYKCASCGDIFDNPDDVRLSTINFSGEYEKYYIETWNDGDDQHEINEINGKTISGLKKYIRFIKRGKTSDIFEVVYGANYTVTYREGDSKLTVTVENPIHVHDRNLRQVVVEGVTKYQCASCKEIFDSPNDAERDDITFLAEDEIVTSYGTDNQPLFQVMGYNDTIKDVDITIYHNGDRVQNISAPGEYTVKINSIKVKHNNTTDVTNCYEFDLKNAQGTIKIESAGQQSLEDGSDIATSVLP